MPPITLDGSLGITTPTYGGADTSEYLVPVTAFKNRIINGNMTIDQRNAGASVTVNSTSGVYPVDRFVGIATGSAGVFTSQQSSTAPVGFNNSIINTVTTASTPSGSNQYNIRHNIEGYNVADLNWGTADAKTVTLSFWVRSSLTGTFGGALANSAFDRSYPFTYTISSANTWEYKTVTIAGDTTGTWLKDNGIGIRVIISLGAGSTLSGTAGAWGGATYVSATGATNVIATNGATFYITGVQLEVGSTATSFDYRPYGTELQLCQRYYEKFALTTTAMFAGRTLDGNRADTSIPLKVTKRATPSLVMGTVSGYIIYPPYQSTSITLNGTQTYSIIFESTDSAGIRTEGGATLSSVYPINTQINATFAFSAEL